MSAHEKFTIIGGAGFIGSHLRTFLTGQGVACRVPERSANPPCEGNLGHVIYCAGTTSDFRQRPFDTVEAHVSLLNGVLRDCDFDSLTYFSSTRVYIHSDNTAEDAFIRVRPNNLEDIFGISKVAGESLCVNSGRHNVRAIRVSNVIGEDFGSQNFVFDLMQAAHDDGKIILRTGLESEKDYVHIADVVETTVAIARHGTEPIYNLACGTNITNAEIIGQIRREIPTGLEVVANAPAIKLRPIDTSRIIREFGFSPRPALPYVRELAAKFRRLRS